MDHSRRDPIVGPAYRCPDTTSNGYGRLDVPMPSVVIVVVSPGTSPTAGSFC